MKKEENRLSIKNGFLIVLIVEIASLVLLLVVSLIMIIVHGFTRNDVFIYIMLGLMIVVGVIFILSFVFSYRWQYQLFYKSIYLTTYRNLKNLNNDSISLEKYSKDNVEEISELNHQIEGLSTKFDNAFLVTHNVDYSSLSLEYLDKEHHLISFYSFKRNLSSLIFLSQSFRNVVIEVYFDIGEREFSSDENAYLLKLYFDAFKDFENTLFAFNDSAHSLLIYLPVVDSFSRINEILYFLIKESSIISRTIQGTGNIPARYCIVAYPYSSEDSILSDLRYAKRQNKVVNFFLPNRVKNNVNEKVLMHTSMNINYMSRILNSLATLDYLNESEDKNKEHILSVLNDLSKYTETLSPDRPQAAREKSVIRQSEIAMIFFISFSCCIAKK